jgi:excinuclease ABC subunit C
MTFHKIDSSTVPHKPGIYFLYDGNKRLVYIGKAKDIKNRMAEYRYLDFLTRPQFKGMTLKYIDYIIIDDKKERKEREKQFIKKYNPPLNILYSINRQTKIYYYIDLKSEDILEKM